MPVQLTELGASLLKALGRLPEPHASYFVRMACDALEQVDIDLEPPQAVNIEREQATSRIHVKVTELLVAMSQAYEVGATFPDPLITMLKDFAYSTQPIMVNQKPAHRPTEFPPSAKAIIWLAHCFRLVFRVPPTLGTNSPFVRFCRQALPKYGLRAPSVTKIKTLLIENDGEWSWPE